MNEKDICFGIISWLPDKETDREARIKRLNRLISQLNNYWPSISIMIIAQNWKDFNILKLTNRQIIFEYPPLGILKARQTLRKHFLESKFNYIILFDDDAIIESNNNDHIEYIHRIMNHPKGFAFVKGSNNEICPYAHSQLNLCAISRYIFEKEDFPNIDPQKSEGFEDRIFSTLLHYKYNDLEFDVPQGLRHTHFKNPKENCPSTWAGEKQYNWEYMSNNTLHIEKFIRTNHKLPDDIKSYSLDRNDKSISYDIFYNMLHKLSNNDYTLQKSVKSTDNLPKVSIAETTNMLHINGTFEKIEEN